MVGSIKGKKINDESAEAKGRHAREPGVDVMVRWDGKVDGELKKGGKLTILPLERTLQLV